MIACVKQGQQLLQPPPPQQQQLHHVMAVIALKLLQWILMVIQEPTH